MALTSFNVANQKALRLASCEAVPPVMLIAGPNGAGKSTLLYALHRQPKTKGTTIIYQPPHRAIRRTQVRRRFLGSMRRLMDVFVGNEVSGFEGLSVPFPARAPDNVDEAGSTIKHTLGGFENRRTAVLSSMFDRHRVSGTTIDPVTLPNVYEPVQRLVSRLLPHLSFKKVDFSDEDNIKCIFDRTDSTGTVPIDLDDLSSGEKSILLLFLPLIEHEIRGLLDEIEAGTKYAANPAQQGDLVFLIDEAEQHLHPDLQARMLGYLREEAARRHCQFIVATHSPTLVDQATDSELYVLNYATDTTTNQLRRVATTAQRLDAIRALTGSTYVITTGRSLVCVEGERDKESGPTDVRLLEILHPSATRYTWIPVGGKGNVIRVVKELRDALRQEHYGLAIFGVVDRDRQPAPGDGVVAWPVCTIENLLLEPDSIAECVAKLGIERKVVAAEVSALLAEAGREQREEEIRLRVMDAIGTKVVRVKAVSLDEARTALAQARTELRVDEAQLSASVDRAVRDVDAALADGTFLRAFRGKQMLRDLYARLHLGEAQVSYERFVYTLAAECATRPQMKALLDQVFSTFAANS